MSNPIGKDDQLVIIVKQRQQFRGGTWGGSLEIDGGREYSFDEILVLANDDPDTIITVLKVDKHESVTNLTNDVLQWAKENP